jgi:aldose 1-epimerase
MAPLTLRAGDWQARLLPAQGAAFAALRLAGRDLIVPIPEGAEPGAGFHGAFWMAPWTNRLDGGRIACGGVLHHMPVNRPAERTALHGFLRDLPWAVEQAAPDRAVLACRFDRPPFRGTARLAVALSPQGLALDVALTNGAAVATPMGIGWHPFFVRPPGTRLRIAAATVFGRDARNLPVAPRPTAGLAGGDAVLDGLDTHFAGWQGVAEIAPPDGVALTLRATGAWSANLQVFAPRGAGILCVEPVSHAPDAANRAASAVHGAMHVLASGVSLDASLTIHRR